MNIFEMTKCPHCGGTTGFHYRLRLVGTQFTDWCKTGSSYDGLDDRHANFVEDTAKSKHGAYWCGDCGKQIKALTGQPKGSRPRA